MGNVEKILGNYSHKEEIKPSGVPTDYKICEKAYYVNKSIEIAYIDGKADWITINNPQNAVFDKSILLQLGLEKIEPTFANDNVVRWNNIPPFQEIAIFAAPGKRS